jgi:hypothetical protein
MEDNEIIKGSGIHFEKTYFGNEFMTADMD